MIKIVTDSTSYMTEAFRKEHDITIIPLSVNTASGVFVEGMPGSFEPIFVAMEADPESKTSMPAPEAFSNAFKRILDEGNEVFCLCISSALSGTFANSVTYAAKGLEGVTIYDSGAAAEMTLLLIEELVEGIAAGETRAQLVARLEAKRDKCSIMFLPYSLKALARGGRLNLLTRAIGTLLHLKPLLTFKNNILMCKSKFLGMQNALKGLVNEIPAGARKIYVLAIYSSQFFDQLLDMVKVARPSAEVLVGEIGPVVGNHVGRGAVGVAYIV